MDENDISNSLGILTKHLAILPVYVMNEQYFSLKRQYHEISQQ